MSTVMIAEIVTTEDLGDEMEAFLRGAAGRASDSIISRLARASGHRRRGNLRRVSSAMANALAVDYRFASTVSTAG